MAAANSAADNVGANQSVSMAYGVHGARTAVAQQFANIFVAWIDALHAHMRESASAATTDIV